MRRQVVRGAKGVEDARKARREVRGCLVPL
jgi:hypothetical protein